jgi:hypothetical protein
MRESDGVIIGPNLIVGGESVDGLTIGPDGMLYAAANTLGTSNVTRGNPLTGGFGYTFVTSGQGGLGAAVGLAFAGDGHLYTSSRNFGGGSTEGVMKFNGMTGATIGVPILPGDNGLAAPTAVLTLPGGDLLVGDSQRVNRYHGTTNAFVSTFVAPGAGGIGFIDLNNGTIGPDGNLYLPDFDHDRVLRFNGTNGAFIDVFANANNPTASAFGADGNLYVTSSFGPLTIQRFNGVTGAAAGSITPTAPNFIWSISGLLVAPVPEPAGAALLGLVVAGIMHRRPGDRKRSQQGTKNEF